jgi:toxin-antitoxin system PIN domain toxin
VRAALLDVNVLLALAWPNHQHHGIAQRWFRDNAEKGWATCGLTQLAFVRLSSNPAFTADAALPREAAGLLQTLIQHSGHRFLNSPGAADPAIFANAIGHQEVNDAWLVEVARQNACSLVTLDRRLFGHARHDRLVELIGA